jgi:ketosteroid isomerase-like protein
MAALVEQLDKIEPGGAVGTGRDLWTEMEALHNQQNVAGAADLFTDDAVAIMPDGRYEGRVAIKGWLKASTEGFSDFKMETSTLLEEEDNVMVEWTLKLTHVTGQNVELRGATVAVVRNGKFATYHDYFNRIEPGSQ